MRIHKSDRGFIFLLHPTYLKPEVEDRVVSESSAIGEYEDSMDNPGSSYLWIGDQHHLNREEVAQLVQHLQTWLETKRLE